MVPAVAYIYALYIAAKIKKNIRRTLAAASPLSLEQGMCKEYSRKLEVVIERMIPIAFQNQRGFFISHDREFHVTYLPNKPNFKVMLEGWDGTVRDRDEVHYEISMKEDEMLYQEFVQRINFNKMKVNLLVSSGVGGNLFFVLRETFVDVALFDIQMAGKVNCHKYSRRRSNEGWNIMVKKLGPRGKCGNGGGWKFMSMSDGSSRALNDMEKMYVRRETPRKRCKILP
ncbi:protein GAMETE CELL DEFECTIVE 1, mitochondrial-like [Actinidia eriantha]|uniref:protein GAMETE CELL DEFECTIVE 1, mitochondrial-like n=1 Tax=Actinidia eriantha TaxID=165200 RepID=UPI0025910D2F|nr:protein GAMETE CELL DEFECTIVE 1, mitochondrial-like [Actinidia eriantha]